ncbi:MAG: CvfB family protein [bacterium]
MIEIGKHHTLTIARERDQGLYLKDKEGDEVLLPNRYKPESFQFDDEIDVFVYLDNEERPVATTDNPTITRDEFAVLRCNEVTSIGAFLDFGLVKELFCPFKEQAFKMKKGQWYLVYCYLDEESERLVASSKTKRFLDNSVLDVAKFDKVSVIISHPSDIGMNVIVNKKYAGLIHNDDLYKEVSVGDVYDGFVKKVHANNKLDITLREIGYKALEPNANKLLSILKDNNGFLPFHDKSDPEEIKNEFEMSKKSFKKAIGNLYKEKQIRIQEDGIYLI